MHDQSSAESSSQADLARAGRNYRVGEAFLGMSEHLAWYTGYALQGMSFTKQGKNWLLRVKATNGKGEPLVAFIASPNFSNCIILLWQGIEGKVKLDWRPDKWGK